MRGGASGRGHDGEIYLHSGKTQPGQGPGHDQGAHRCGWVWGMEIAVGSSGHMGRFNNTSLKAKPSATRTALALCKALHSL